jgi:type IV pilus assembly protein PilC
MADFKQRLQLALIYPVILAVTAFCIISFLMLKVVPVFGEIFGEFGAALPAPTQFLIDGSAFFRAYFDKILLALAVLAAGIIGLFLWLRRSVAGRCRLDTLKLYLPWIGPAYHMSVQARFCRLMGLLLSARVPVLDAMELSGAASGSPVLERALEDAVLEVASGERLADALEHTRFFGHDTCWLLATSEERGTTEEAFSSLAGRLEHQASTHEKFIGAMAAPVFVIVIGLAVAFVVFSMYMPIFTIGDSMGG